MIKIYNLEDKENITLLIEEDKLQNAYLYIDVKMYGYSGENVETYILSENSDIYLILYKYYNSLQIYQNIEITENGLVELCNFIEEKKFKMISGKINVIEKIITKLNKEYKMTTGCIMKKIEKVTYKGNLSKIANEEQCENIAKLICSDKNIGGHYIVKELKEQLIDRMKNRNCKNLIIEKNNEIISHIGIYADIEDISVLGGLITHDKYKGLGYGRQILDDLTYLVQNEGKLPILYCYDEKLIEWYEKLKWKKITSCAKLEKIK